VNLRHRIERLHEAVGAMPAPPDPIAPPWDAYLSAVLDGRADDLPPRLLGCGLPDPASFRRGLAAKGITPEAARAAFGRMHAAGGVEALGLPDLRLLRDVRDALDAAFDGAGMRVPR
jgi:hypothetical protein